MPGAEWTHINHTQDELVDRLFEFANREADTLISYELTADDVFKNISSRSSKGSVGDEFRKQRTVEDVCNKWHLREAAHIKALTLAYDTAYSYVAPFTVQHVDEMLRDCKADIKVRPNSQYAFLGRTGMGLAVAAATLEPEFFVNHCALLPLSRHIVETALQDLKINAGREVGHLTEFYTLGPRIRNEDVTGAHLSLTEYLQSCGISPHIPKQRITLIDTGFRGILQELLATTYPDIDFQGRYLFFAESRDDPHPGSKTGYALHLKQEKSNGGRPVLDLPDDPSETFAHLGAVLAVEDMLAVPNDPEAAASGQRGASTIIQGINPLDIVDEFAHPAVRGAVIDLNVLAVRDYAERISMIRSANGRWIEHTRHSSQKFVTKVRQWISGNDRESDFAKIMSSFVRKSDWEMVSRLHDAIERHELRDDEATAAWRNYRARRTPEERHEYIEAFTSSVGDRSKARVLTTRSSTESTESALVSMRNHASKYWPPELQAVVGNLRSAGLLRSHEVSRILVSGSPTSTESWDWK
ncbi:hypothetical protein [Nocardia sp. N2S4-5]|uniref:hypothetical protein n=1 Tax=Nocardia sp. N2S4-5 TaxID=3351565 RepID=UPI0037D8E269